MKLLLHTCCAPCMIYPYRYLCEQGFSVEGFFYNPNIHPLSEYQRRKEAVIKWAEDNKMQVQVPEYVPAEFFRAVYLKEDPERRCRICWKLRLGMTALEAKNKGFSHFSTTLLVSPYQNQEAIKDIGEDVAKEVGVEFYYTDFRPGFRKAHQEAKEQGIYCQNYCGCIYSEVERFKR